MAGSLKRISWAASAAWGGIVEPTRYSPKALRLQVTGMRQALSSFLSLLAIMIILKMFAPTLADQVIEIVGKLFTVINQLLDAAVQQSQQSEAVSMLLMIYG